MAEFKLADAFQGWQERAAWRDAIAKRLVLRMFALDEAAQFRLDERALRELVEEIDDFIRNQPNVKSADSRKRLRKARRLLRRGRRALADSESTLREAERLLRAAALDGSTLRDPLALPALLGLGAAQDEDQLIDQLDALTELSAALREVRSERTPQLEGLLKTITVAVRRIKGSRGRTKRHGDREIAQLARAFWERERERILSQRGEDIGPATCDYRDKDGIRDGPPVEGKNNFSRFFGDFMKELAGWDLQRCQTSLGRWDGSARAE